MSDHNERACWNCGSYLHHEDSCPKPNQRVREVPIERLEWSCGCLAYARGDKISVAHRCGFGENCAVNRRITVTIQDHGHDPEDSNRCGIVAASDLSDTDHEKAE